MMNPIDSLHAHILNKTFNPSNNPIIHEQLVDLLDMAKTDTAFKYHPELEANAFQINVWNTCKEVN